MPELSTKESVILKIIHEYWPISSLEIAEHLKESLGSRQDKRKASTKYAYYLKKLIEKRLVLSKRVGNALIVWPVDVERYRTVHHILKEKQHVE